MSETITARIEVFRPGTFVPMQGDALTYTAADLRAVADAYDPKTAPAPVVVGHPETDAPAYGWVKRFDYDSDAERLYAEVEEIEPSFAELVKAGRYRKVSMSFFAPTHGANPVPGTWYPKHLGFLGAAAPAVPGLRNAHFSIAPAEAVTFSTEFGGGFRETAGVLRAIRDLFIEKFGLEATDKVLPAWRIDWIDDAATEAASPAFAAPSVPTPDPETQKEPAVTQPPDPAFAAREADIATRETALAAREAATRHAEHVAFAEGLVADGRLLPATRDKVVAILDALPVEATVSFAAGEAKQTPAEALKAVLAAQPKVVTFGAAALPGGPAGDPGQVAFAADGKSVDRAELETHAAAETFMRAHPGTAYLDAVRAVS